MDIKLDKTYKYVYDPDLTEQESEVTKELEAISAKEPYALVVDDHDNPDLVLVDFDIEQNIGKGLPYSGEYVVAKSELQDSGMEQPVLEETEEEEKVAESIDTNETEPTPSNDYPSILVAINSEKDAEMTYKALLEIENESDSPNQEVIDLLQHILDDELEHIALLSALAAKQNSEFVEGEDSQEKFDSYVDDTVEVIDNQQETKEE